MQASDIASESAFQSLLRLALAEDIGTGDVTSEALVPEDATATGRILSREDCVVSGMAIGVAVFQEVDGRIECRARLEDGQEAKAGEVLLELSGPARSILTAERTALNFMQRMCGVATTTKQYVDAVSGHDVRILDTRKTIPGYRALDKYAVRCGGGENHRMGLYDRVMMKDNHRQFLSADRKLGLAETVAHVRVKTSGVPIEIEVETEEEFRLALEQEPEWILLDNMSPADMSQLVALRDGEKTQFEASGGITLASIAEVAASGVDAISLGCLTHSVRAIDLSLEFEEAG